MRGLFALALTGLRETCRQRGRERARELFERHDLVEPEERPSYDTLAADCGATPAEVSVGLAFARREFRRILLDRLREITATDEEFRLEARLLLGREP